MARVIVCGGLLLDITFELTQWITPQSIQQTVHAMQGPGGKGINQAVAARRLGAEVLLVGSVGADIAGRIILETLDQEKVNTGLVTVQPSVGTGLVSALLYEGTPTFVAFKGASMLLSVEAVERTAEFITPETIVLINFEVPQPTVAALLRLAKSRGATTILNPAPLEIDPSQIDYWSLVDMLIPNIREAQGILGVSHTNAVQLLKPLLDKGIDSVCITLGEEGCIFADQTDQNSWQRPIFQPIFPVNARDTTGASDAFCGAFALALAEHYPISETLRFASAVAALACTQLGGMSAMPYRAAVDALLTTQ